MRHEELASKFNELMRRINDAGRILQEPATMTTNDPAEKYGEEKSKREPLLARDADFWDMAGYEVQEYYERLIDEGRLKVVEEVSVDNNGCCSCGKFVWMPNDSNGDSMIPNFCPGCGNPVKR